MWAKVKDQDGIWKYQVAINLLIFNFNGTLLVTHAWPVFSVSFSECVASCWWKRSNLLCFSDLLFVRAPSDTDTPRQLYSVFRYGPLKYPTYIQWTQQIPAIIGTHKSEGLLQRFFHEKPVGHIFFPLSFTHFTIENIPPHKMFFYSPKQETAELMYHCGATVYIRL